VKASTGSTEHRFLSSAVAAYGSQLGRMLLRIVAELVLARLLIPREHALFDLALPIVTIAGAVRDLGLGYQLVRDDRRPYGTVLAWVLGAGGVLTVGLSLAAPLFAGLDPGLPAVMRVFSLWVFLDGLAVVPRIFFERQLQVSRLVGPEILRGVAFTVAAVALALLHWGVWSFVLAELGSAALFAALLWRRARGLIPLERRLDLLPDLLRRSMALFFIWLAALATPYIGRYVIPAFADSVMVAHFAKAQLWAMRLQILVLPALMRVLYPALVEYRDDHPRFVGAYRLGTVSILALEALAAYFLFFNAETVLLKIFLGPQWAPAVPLLRILCFVPLTDPFTRLGGEVLKVRHDDRAWLASVVLNFLCLLGFGIFLTSRMGTPGMAWAQYLLLGNFLLAWRVYRICGREMWVLARDLAFVYLLPLPAFLAVGWLFPQESWGRFAASIAAAALVGGLLVLRFQGPFRSFFGKEARA
jgi:O-antigen/teichoic acid export membrane protein